MSKPSASLDEFCARAYANHDEAHNDEHGKQVLGNAHDIINLEQLKLTTQEKHELPYVMRCHDVRDDKAVRNGVALPEEEIAEYYTAQLGTVSAERIKHIHANCSWSKRKVSQPTPGGDTLRLVLQDADWLEAIGEVGIIRCINYNRFIKPKASPEEIAADVCQHIHEKLLHIPAELNFASSRRIVEVRGLLNPLHEYLAIHEKK